MSSIETLRDEIRSLYQELRTWQLVGDRLGISRAVAWRIVNDNYEPKDNDTRRELGLDELVIIRQSRNAKGRYQKRTN